VILADPSPITRDGAAADARHELAKSIYHHDSDPLPVRILESVGRFIDRVLNNAFDGAPGGAWGALLLVVLVAGCIALVLWRVGLPVRRQATAALFTEARIVSADDHRRRSIQAADVGDWHTAVVERMRAVARELEQRGVLDLRPGRTASELAAEAAVALPPAGSVLSAAARTFNEVAYGGAAAGPADLATITAADDAVTANLTRPVPV
jgi:hypothetical protein